MDQHGIQVLMDRPRQSRLTPSIAAASARPPMSWARTRSRVLIVGIIVICAFATWIAFHSAHSVASASERRPRTTQRTELSWRWVAGSAGKAMARTIAMQKPSASSLWVRPPPQVTAQRSEHAGLAWIMRQLGANDRLIDELAGPDIAGAIDELKHRAMTGDPTAINVLGEFAFQQCYLGRSPGVLNEFLDLSRANARRLAPADAAWFDAEMQADVAHDKRVAAACAQWVNVDQVMTLVEAQANAGNGASAWLTSRYDNHLAESQQWLRTAAIEGFPQAQFDLAWAIIGHQSGAAGTGSHTVTAGAMLRASEQTLPDAQSELGVCEFYGCSGVAIDPQAAIRDARQAAARGSLGAILMIGPRAQESLIDPVEVSAWRVIQASLEQQGCSTSGIYWNSMNRFDTELDSHNASPPVKALADRYWSAYGAQMMANLGC